MGASTLMAGIRSRSGVEGGSGRTAGREEAGRDAVVRPGAGPAEGEPDGPAGAGAGEIVEAGPVRRGARGAGR
ncbi:hypothetical protein ACFVDT_33790 [Streptomyces sp. NPDC057699]|uniref:hypothetical protein n=1 Tax=Streptomyces sp. NPDC057699 TaxID=3346220 RepID=UPI0036C0104D